MTESHLCSLCAGELYNQHNMPIPVINLFKNDVDSDIFNMLNFNKNLYQIAEKKVCSMCGWSFTNIDKTGKVGCGGCYETFKNELTPTVMQIHGTAKHTGKIPKNRSAQISAKRKIEELNIKMKKVIAEQNFEEAAVIRDEINKINAEMQGGAN